MMDVTVPNPSKKAKDTSMEMLLDDSPLSPSPSSTALHTHSLQSNEPTLFSPDKRSNFQLQASRSRPLSSFLAGNGTGQHLSTPKGGNRWETSASENPRPTLASNLDLGLSKSRVSKLWPKFLDDNHDDCSYSELARESNHRVTKQSD